MNLRSIMDQLYTSLSELSSAAQNSLSLISKICSVQVVVGEISHCGGSLNDLNYWRLSSEINWKQKMTTRNEGQLVP